MLWLAQTSQDLFWTRNGEILEQNQGSDPGRRKTGWLPAQPPLVSIAHQGWKHSVSKSPAGSCNLKKKSSNPFWKCLEVQLKALWPSVVSSLHKNIKTATVAQLLSQVWLFATPRTVAHQTPLSVGFPVKNVGAGCHVLLQVIFLIQSPNLISCITGGRLAAEPQSSN